MFSEVHECDGCGKHYSHCRCGTCPRLTDACPNVPTWQDGPPTDVGWWWVDCPAYGPRVVKVFDWGQDRVWDSTVPGSLDMLDAEGDGHADWAAITRCAPVPMPREVKP